MDDIRIRPAEDKDVTEIADVIRLSFEPELLQTTIYSCEGIASYIEQQIRVPCGCSDTAYAVATDDGAVTGCIELRRFFGRLCLNYIAVRPQDRRRGVANALLSGALSFFQRSSDSAMFLDVFLSNRTASDWYERIGFKTDYTTRLWEVAPGDPMTGMNVTLAGYPQAEACQRAYGFSEFSLLFAGRQHTIGRIGGKYFRVRDLVAVEEKECMGFLAALDRSRRALCTTRRDEELERLPENRKLLVESHRMSVSLDVLKGAL